MGKFDISSSDEPPFSALANLQSALATPHLRDAVSEYFDAASTFAGHTFDSLGSNPSDQITTDDLLAVTLLDVPWSPTAVRQLLGELSDKVSQLLQVIDGNATMWDSARGCQDLINAEALWNVIDAIPGVGSTRTSKLLARKRPSLVPITDRVILSAVGTSGTTWRTLRYCFQHQSFRDAAESVRPSNAESASLLRIFDVAIWMLCSGSRAARRVRHRVGMSDG
jgi:hypothetical protein